ncbi:MAG: hypothetical protein ACOVS5_02870 [Oligoflexus sp.]
MVRRRPVADRYPSNEHSDDTLLFVLTPATGGGTWIEELKAEAIPAFQREIHYARIHIGLKGPRRPYAVVEWLEQERSSLERRWVLSHFLRTLRQQFRVKQLCTFIFDSDSFTQDVVLAEDAYFAAMKPNDEGNDWSDFEILHTVASQVDVHDPYSAIRWDGVLAYRRWINENPDELTSLEIGRRLKAFAESHGCTFEELGVEELKKEGMNLLVAVGQASKRSPSRCYLLGSHLGKGGRPLMLLGKGITFDTGGINVKTHDNLVHAMKNDMGGAALMSQLFISLVKSGFDKPLLLVIPTCENLVDADSMKPGSLIQSHKGIKVLVEHTDAEGRLILADAMSYAHGRYRPAMTLCAATLTTASLRQFSGYFTAVHFAGSKVEGALQEAGQRWGERFSCWEDFLPFKAANSTKAGDLTNLGRLPSHAHIGGGSNVAAHFLREFTSEPFIHFDIFATCWNWSGDYPGSVFGATGAPFNSLFDLLRHNSAALGI